MLFLQKLQLSPTEISGSHELLSVSKQQLYPFSRPHTTLYKALLHAKFSLNIFNPPEYVNGTNNILPFRSRFLLSVSN